MLNNYLVSENEFFELREEWEGLLKHTEDLDFFSTWEWTYSWWRNFKEDRELFVLVFRNDERQLVGIFPGCILTYKYLNLLRIRVLQFIGRGIDQNSIGEYSDFLDVIAHKDYKTQVYDSLLQYLSSRQDYDIIYLNFLKETGSFFSYLRNTASTHFRDCYIPGSLSVYFASLPDDIDDYLAELSASFRASIRRKVRKWKKNHNEPVQVVNDDKSMEDFYENFFHLVRKRHEKNVSQVRRTFHQEVANYLIEKDRFLGIYTKLKNKYAAIAVVYLFNKKGYFYQHAINPQFSKSSPGIVLFYYMFEKTIKDKINRFEFMRGEYDYKRQWGTDQHYLSDIYLGMGTLRSKLFFLINPNLSRAKNLIKRIFHKDSN